MRAVRSVFSDEKLLSIAELSQTLLARLIEQVMPLSNSEQLERLADKLRPPIGMMQKRVSLAAVPDCHHQGFYPASVRSPRLQSPQPFPIWVSSDQDVSLQLGSA